MCEPMRLQSREYATDIATHTMSNDWNWPLRKQHVDKSIQVRDEFVKPVALANPFRMPVSTPVRRDHTPFFPEALDHELKRDGAILRAMKHQDRRMGVITPFPQIVANAANLQRLTARRSPRRWERCLQHSACRFTG